MLNLSASESLDHTIFYIEWKWERRTQGASKSLILDVSLLLPLASIECDFLKRIFTFYRWCVLTFRASHRRILLACSSPWLHFWFTNFKLSSWYRWTLLIIPSLNSRIIKESDGLIRSRYLPFTIGLYDLSPVEPKWKRTLIEPQDRSF